MGKLVFFLLFLVCLAVLALVQLDFFPVLWEHLPTWLIKTIQPVLFIFPSLVVILSAVLVFTALKRLNRTIQSRANLPSEALSSQPEHGSLFATLRFAGAVILLLALAYVTYWAAVWDRTSDGLGGIWLLYQSVITAVIGGAVMGIKARSWFRSAGFLFALLVPLILIGAFSSGYSVSYQQLTEKRAARISSALEHYHTRQGRYPGQLQELVPRDLLWVPSQVILRDEQWCYLGENDAYRLGAYWRAHFSTPLELKVYASVGTPPNDDWACQTGLPEKKKLYDPIGISIPESP